MSSNTERMRLFVEQVQNNGHLGLIDQLISPDFRNHTPEPGQDNDRESVRASMTALRNAFSGFEVEIRHIVGDGDMVATYKVFRGRHTGEWFGIPPSGKPFELAVMDHVQYRDGMQIAHWAVADALGFLRQTGVLERQ